MAKLKHSKFKNTGILFELLVRQIASDTLANKDSLALEIIKKHFKKGTELTKELKLYQSLTKENFDKGEKQFKDDFKANLEEVGGATELASDMALYETGKTELDANKSDFQGVGKHNNQTVATVAV